MKLRYAAYADAPGKRGIDCDGGDDTSLFAPQAQPQMRAPMILRIEFSSAT